MKKLIYIVASLAFATICHAAGKEKARTTGPAAAASNQSQGNNRSQSSSAQSGDQGMGDYIKQLRAQGLKGQDLADAIHAEQLRRGIGQGNGKPGGPQTTSRRQNDGLTETPRTKNANAEGKSQKGKHKDNDLMIPTGDDTEATNPADEPGNQENGRDAKAGAKGKGKSSKAKK